MSDHTSFGKTIYTISSRSPPAGSAAVRHSLRGGPFRVGYHPDGRREWTERFLSVAKGRLNVLSPSVERLEGPPHLRIRAGDLRAGGSKGREHICDEAHRVGPGTPATPTRSIVGVRGKRSRWSERRSKPSLVSGGRRLAAHARCRKDEGAAIADSPRFGSLSKPCLTTSTPTPTRVVVPLDHAFPRALHCNLRTSGWPT